MSRHRLLGRGRLCGSQAKFRQLGIYGSGPQWYVEHHDPLDYYRDKLGFDCLSTWQNPPVYAIVARDQHAIHFRLAQPSTPNPDKYADELLDAYLFIEDADALYAEYAAGGVEFTRGLANMPWHSREFVVKDCDGRLLAFGANPE